MEQLITNYPWLSLFIVSFGASTLLPLGSEWLLALLVAQGYQPLAAVAVATIGNFLGGVTTYLIGWWGSDFIILKIMRISEESSLRARRLFGRWGVWSLLFSWLPVVGDPLCLVAGMLRTNFLVFSILVILGKAARYYFVTMLAVKTFS